MCPLIKTPTMESDQSQRKLEPSVTTPTPQEPEEEAYTFFHQQQQQEQQEVFSGSYEHQQEQQEAFTGAPNKVAAASFDGARIHNNNAINNLNIDLPPGYRFVPTDAELIVYYLNKKVKNEPLPPNKIREVNLYQENPKTLLDKYRPLWEKDFYFFTPRDRKYPNGNRPSRGAVNGYWKATGADKAVKLKGVTLGYRKVLVFYEGKPPKGDKTNWIMHEYRANGPPRTKTGANDMRLDDWVLCRIYEKCGKSAKNRQLNDTVDEGEVVETSQALFDEDYPVVNNDFMGMDYLNYNGLGASNGLNFGAYIQPPPRLPENPPFVDASAPNFGDFNGHLQSNFTYGSGSVSSMPPVLPMDNILRSSHPTQDDYQLRGFQRDISITPSTSVFPGHGYTDSDYTDRFLNLDYILPNTARDHPSNNNPAMPKGI